MSALDGKYTIEYDLSKPVQNVGKVDGIANAAPDVPDLGRIDDIQKALSNKAFRVNLSSLLAPWSNVRVQASKFALLLQDQKITEARDTFVSMTKGNKNFKSVTDYLKAEKDPVKLQAALFDLRGGMMMDVAQANKIQANGTEVSITENIGETQKRFEGMMKNPNMKRLLDSMGLDIADYASLIRA